MTNKLASPTFAAGVSDALAVADKYKTLSGVNINSIQEITHSAGAILTNLINGVKGDATNILSSLTGQVKVNTDALMSRLLANKPDIKSAFGSLSNLSKENVLSKLQSDSSLTATINGVITTINGAQFDRISGLKNICQRLTGSDFVSLTDNNAFSSLMSGLVKEANQLGIKGVLPMLLEGELSNDLINNIIKTSIPDLVKFGDLESINGLLSKSTGTALNDIYPNFATDLAKAFQLKINPNGSLNVAESYAGLINILNLTDSNWNKFVRQGGADTGYSLAKILAGTPAHISTFQQGGRSDGTGNHKLHALVGNVKLRTVADDVRKNFGNVIPKTASILQKSTSGSTSKSSTSDPIVINAIAALGLLGTVLFG